MTQTLFPIKVDIDDCIDFLLLALTGPSPPIGRTLGLVEDLPNPCRETRLGY